VWRLEVRFFCRVVSFPPPLLRFPFVDPSVLSALLFFVADSYFKSADDRTSFSPSVSAAVLGASLRPLLSSSSIEAAWHRSYGIRPRPPPLPFCLPSLPRYIVFLSTFFPPAFLKFPDLSVFFFFPKGLSLHELRVGVLSNPPHQGRTLVLCDTVALTFLGLRRSTPSPPLCAAVLVSPPLLHLF